MTPYYDPEGGGLERYAHEVLRRLTGKGHEVHAVSFTRNGSHGEEQKDGVQLQRRRPRFFVGNAPVDPRFSGGIGQKIREAKPDVVIAHTPVPFPAEVAGRAARKHRVPFVVTYHAGRLRGSTRTLDWLATLDRHTFERSMLSKSQALIAVSPFVRENALGRWQDRVHIIPPGVAAQRYRPDGPPPLDPNVLFVGPLSESYRWKGVDVLWNAFRQVQRRFPAATLTLVGDGDRRQTLAALAKKQGLNVDLPGRLDEDALICAYGASNMVVLPSTSDAESFGMVLAEANACERPVIGSRIGGIPGFVRHRKNGLLVTPGDPQELADRITQLLLDPEQAIRLGKRGREIVSRHHDWDRLAERTEAVLEQASR